VPFRTPLRQPNNLLIHFPAVAGGGREPEETDVRGRKGQIGRLVRVLATWLGLSLAGIAAASSAQAAAPALSLTPYVSCFWDNGDGTVTVSLGVNSTNSGPVTVAVGPANYVTVGAQDRGQPTVFQPGRRDNVWAATVSYGDLARGVDWSLTGNTVSLVNATVCSQKPVPADGNALAVAAFGVLVTAVGSVALNGRRRRTRSAERFE
jgi:hypothetical protein